MMHLIEKAGLRVLRSIDPEAAHGLALRAVHTPLVHKPGPISTTRLSTRIAGLDLPNPIGLAAGFDKNAIALGPLMQAGFGFLEVGAATPKPQPGNPKPRLFRLTEDRGVINRFGFNNDGAEVIAQRLAARPNGIPVGLNLGANKDSTDKADDFAQVMKIATQHIDFATINVSSPNTEKLRDLQGAKALSALLQGVMAVRSDTPVFLKIAPDLTPYDLADIAAIATENGVDAIIATNTTVSRDGLQSAHASQAGGLSGKPLFDLSTKVLAQLSTLTTIPLIGVGGVSSGADAFAKIQAGASAVQLYTALAYQGLSLVTRIAEELDDLLAKNGFSSVLEAVGTKRENWLNIE